MNNLIITYKQIVLLGIHLNKFIDELIECVLQNNPQTSWVQNLKQAPVLKRVRACVCVWREKSAGKVIVFFCIKKVVASCVHAL